MAGLMATASSAQGQYIGLVYPAGGQQGTTFQVRLGGQRLSGLSGAVVTGEGVEVKLVEYRRRLSNQEVQLMREQVRGLRKVAAPKKGEKRNKRKPKPLDPETQKMVDRINLRIKEWTNRPACAALAEIAILEVKVAPDAEPGAREVRLITGRGATNPMPFYVGQVPEVTRKPMITSVFQVLGKEGLAQRKRPPEEEEETITVPSTMNGQIASGEVNRYRFKAKKGQRLVVSVRARDLVPYIADAVPGWFQPILSLHDAEGKEVAFSDDFRFKPDPTLYFEVPISGEYVLTITDAIYRGREDFVYRVTLAEAPFVTSIFPLGGRVGEPATIEMAGWNLEKAKLTPPGKNAKEGVHWLTARKKGQVSNAVPFALGTLPECFDEGSNNDPAHAQKVELPIVVNGRADQPDDWDVYEIKGKKGEKIVAEVHARRLDSPLDSMLKLTDADGKVLAFNDDSEDVGSGLNTHHADSYLMAELPADGAYYVHVGDTARAGGKEYAYRLRISAPRPDFALRTSPSSAAFRSKGSGAVTVYAIRKDGFDGDITLSLKDPPEGFSSSKVRLAKGKPSVRIGFKTTLRGTKEPVPLTIEGRAKVGEQEIVREAVPADDRMQAFLWRHLVPAQELAALVYNPSYKPPPTRVPTPMTEEEKAKFASKDPSAKPKFNKRQVASRLRQLKALYEEWFITDEFYNAKVAECETSL